MFNVSGKFPCTCGVQDSTFRDAALFNSRGPFASLKARCMHINATQTWQKGAANGEISVFETLKVSK